MLNDFVKSTLPKSLLARMIIIIALPIILIQIIAGVIFYERHWETVEKKMLNSLVDEIKYINLMYKNIDIKNFDKFRKHDSVIIQTLDKNIRLTDNINQAPISNVLKMLKGRLKKSIPEKIQISYSTRYKQIIVDITHKDKDLVLIFSRKRIYTPTAAIFMYWMIGSSSLLLIITILFAKNQIRSITNLSIAAEKLGNNQTDIKFKPQGATEVKKAGQALIDMHKRIESQIRQRTELLAGVSHDLKTPLTRMKLHLELLKEIEDRQELLDDIKQMEQTLDDYLDFAKSEDHYKTRLVDLEKFITSTIKPYRGRFKKIELDLGKKIFANIRENQFKRAIVNFIENSVRFADNIKIITSRHEKLVTIEIHDNGPGIAKSEMQNVFKPFYRVESSRNSNTGGVGLGMSIASDIIIRHGGKVDLSNSYLGGLLITITINE